jgi:hypothetical protein
MTVNDGLTMSQLAERNAEHVTTIAALLKERDGLKQKCDGLAAENACQKQGIEEIADSFETGTDGALATAVDEAVSLSTPVTDAVLKRIQAQGVDMAIEHLLKKFELTGRIGVPVMALEWLAKELRKESGQ